MLFSLFKRIILSCDQELIEVFLKLLSLCLDYGYYVAVVVVKHWRSREVGVLVLFWREQFNISGRFLTHFSRAVTCENDIISFKINMCVLLNQDMSESFNKSPAIPELTVVLAVLSQVALLAFVMFSIFALSNYLKFQYYIFKNQIELFN